MQLSLTKAITLALLGLGNVVPSVSGAPTDLSHVRAVGRSELPHHVAGLDKRIPKGGKGGGDTDEPNTSGGSGSPDDGPNPGGFGDGSTGSGGGTSSGGPNPGGFGVTPAGPQSITLNIGTLTGYRTDKTTVGNEDSYTVYSNDVNIGDIRVNRDDGSITNDDVNNADDPQGDGRARLHQVQMSVFTQGSGLQPGDLRAIHNENVSEASTAPVLADLARARGESFTISRSSALPEDIADFDRLMATKLGGNAQAVLANNPVGRQISRVEVGPGAGGDDDYNFSIFF